MNYDIKFDGKPFDELDKFALLADQKYNLGDKDNWFNFFRGGLFAFYARIRGIRIHYFRLHEWGEIEAKETTYIEYHIACLFFNLDSALECFVFALNALGYAAENDRFLNITNQEELKRINPFNIINNSIVFHKNEKRNLGYEKYFGGLKKHFSQNLDLIQQAIMQHDVSKHRQAIFKAGKKRLDPPDSFLKCLGMDKEDGQWVVHAPFEEIFLHSNPKSPESVYTEMSLEERVPLEDIVPRYCEFLNQCGPLALRDAKENIKLNHK